MSWLRRLMNTFRSGQLQREIDREISFHMEERADQLRAEGRSDEEAKRRARLRFGRPMLQAERTRDVDIARWLDALSFPDSDRLMRLSQTHEQTSETKIAPVRLEDWNRLNSTFQAITGYYTEDVSETSGDLPEKVRRASVAPRFLEVWGIASALGRGFTVAEHRVGGPSAVLISDRYWRLRLGADPRVLDRTVRIGTESFPIVGVMPASFRFPDREVDLWRPVLVDAKYAQLRQATWRFAPRLTAGRCWNHEGHEGGTKYTKKNKKYSLREPSCDLRVLRGFSGLRREPQRV